MVWWLGIHVLTTLMVLQLVGSSWLPSDSIVHVQSDEPLTAPLEQHTIALRAPGIEAYTAGGQLRASWRSVGSPLAWTKNPERVLFVSPRGAGFAYVLGDPRSTRVYQVSRSFGSAERRSSVGARGRVLRSCDRRGQDCVVMSFDEPVVVVGQGSGQEFVQRWGGFAAGPFGASYEGLVLSAHPCYRAHLFASPGGEWLALWYSPLGGHPCIQMVIRGLHPNDDQPSYAALLSVEQAETMLVEWQQDRSAMSPDGRWLATPLDDQHTVRAAAEDGGDGAAYGGDDEIPDVWWHAGSRRYLYRNAAGIGVASVEGWRRQLLLGYEVSLIGWLGNEVVYLTPLPADDGAVYETAAGKSRAVVAEGSASEAP